MTRRRSLLAAVSILAFLGAFAGATAGIAPRSDSALVPDPSVAADVGRGPSRSTVLDEEEATPLMSGAPASTTARAAVPAPPGVVPVLYYHRAEAPPPEFASWSHDRQLRFIAYDVIPAALAAQLDWLVANGYTTILPRDLAAHWDRGARLPKRPVILTFDDGFHDWVSTVLPMLRARGMVAEFYLTLDAIRSGTISWPEVRSLASAGNGIGAHDVHHVQLARLGNAKPAASSAVMWAEVSGARRIIADHVGVAPDSMAYVGGGFDARLEALAQRAGYTTARSIIRGLVQTSAHRFELRVVRIGPRDDVADLLSGELVPGLPTFARRMHGVP